MSSIPMKDDEALPQDEEVKRAAEMREWIEAKILELEQEVSRLRDMLLLVDSTLRRRSFVSAKELRTSSKTEESQQSPRSGRVADAKMQDHGQTPAQESVQPKANSAPSGEIRELRRSKDGEILATASIDQEKIVITPTTKIKFSSIIPPFQSFFVNRILKGYQSKDLEASKAGSLSATDVLQYNIKESEGFIIEVTIVNYRDKSRLNEILNTATWAFARMLEKK
ncbi:MAG: hypothetical protein ACRECH_05040 [Nitrososphaerales archaeon]